METENSQWAVTVNSAIAAIVLLLLLSVAYQVGWSRSRRLETAHGRLHSRPSYHGYLTVVWALVPAALILIFWALFSGLTTRAYIISMLPPEAAALTGPELEAAIRRIRDIASGFGVAGETQPYENLAGQALREFQMLAFAIVVASAAATGVLAIYITRGRIAQRFRARNEFEGFVRILLIACSAVAILTTVGIVVSLAAEAIRFFSFINPIDFFFGTVWNPGFGTVGVSQGDYGLLPLLWGTIMIAIIAMLVSLPIGLMTAIYLTQYASPRLRDTVKPVIEVLAGIPTIVVPFFADQPFWGRRVAELGVGPEPIPRHSLAVERLTNAIHQATADRGMKSRAAALGQRIKEENGIERAVEAFDLQTRKASFACR
jgi:phosphate transport system permease protein